MAWLQAMIRSQEIITQKAIADQKNEHWKPPMRGRHKFNKIKSLINQDKSIITWRVLRDGNGAEIQWFWSYLEKGEILKTEIWGIINGCDLAINEGLKVDLFYPVCLLIVVRGIPLKHEID